ncbi:MAG: hypothetical protein K6F56_06695 [Oscillospiraceae bacterium]|nr:hypothetical protein [Oscillospiraceae bacterium]
MIGRQVITVNRAFTLQELEQFMQENWDKEQYNSFKLGKPTSASVGEYILLPATRRYLVIVYPKAAGGLFSRENKIVLSVADTPTGAEEAFIEYFPQEGPFTRLWQTSMVLDAEMERRGPAEGALLEYTEHMKSILSKNGLLK